MKSIGQHVTPVVEQSGVFDRSRSRLLARLTQSVFSEAEELTWCDDRIQMLPGVRDQHETMLRAVKPRR